MVDIHLNVAMQTEAGPQGENQDAGYAQEIDGGYIIMVADGMGAPAGGAAASATAASVMEELMEEEFEDVREWVDFAFGETNQRILNHTRLYPDHVGMGTTMTVAVLWRGKMHIGHVGDGRLYRLRAGILEQLTTDHALLGSFPGAAPEGGGAVAGAAGIGTALTRSVGATEDVYPDYITTDIAPGDVFLLCSDGLHRVLSSREITKALGIKDPDDAASALMEMARKRGLMDDVTVLVAGLMPGEDES